MVQEAGKQIRIGWQGGLIHTGTGYEYPNTAMYQMVPSRGTSVDEALSVALQPRKVLLQTLRGLSPQVMEAILSHTTGGVLLLAGLAYGLGVRLADLRMIRLRDVHFGSRIITIQGTRYVIPSLLFEDLRDFIHDRVCGSDASTKVSRRDDIVFGEDLFDALYRHTEQSIKDGVFDWLNPECARLFSGEVSERFVSLCFFVLSRQHAKRIAAVAMKENISQRRTKKKPVTVASTGSSPLDLFDKGPRIVRRQRCGTINSYYLWRIAGPHLL